MILVSVMYPGGSEGNFDEIYYLEKHLPLIRERWTDMGLEHMLVMREVGTPEGKEPPYRVMAVLSFHSLEKFGNAAAAHGADIFADIPRFTNVQPLVQINEPLRAEVRGSDG